MSTSKRPRTHYRTVCTAATSFCLGKIGNFSMTYTNLSGRILSGRISEEAAVFELASLHWKRRRLTIGTQLAFHGQADADALAKAGDDGWEGVARYLKKIRQMAIASVTWRARWPTRTPKW